MPENRRKKLMKDWVKEKLDLIDELFPPERLEASKRRWTCLWSGRLPDDRLPFTHWGRVFLHNEEFLNPDQVEQSLRANLDECIFHGRLRDDFVPSLFPGCKQNTIPSMFGAGQIIVDGTCFAERILHEPADIDKLPEFSMAPGTVANDWLERQKYFLEETDGRIPVHVTDMQGPVDVCGQLWGYTDLFTCAYSDPQRYHKLLGMVTEAFICFWKKQQQLCGENFVGTHLWPWSWLPKGMGATVSADSLAMVSPAFFDEFMKPYYLKIGSELGGVTIHSCGQFGHVVESLQKIECLRGINSSETSLQNLLKAGLRNDKVLILLAEYDKAFEVFRLIKEHSLPAEVSVIMCPLVPTAWRGDEPAMAVNRPADWTQQDWDLMRERESRILDAVAMA